LAGRCHSIGRGQPSHCAFALASAATARCGSGQTARGGEGALRQIGTVHDMDQGLAVAMLV